MSNQTTTPSKKEIEKLTAQIEEQFNSINATLENIKALIKSITK